MFRLQVCRLPNPSDFEEAMPQRMMDFVFLQDKDLTGSGVAEDDMIDKEYHVLRNPARLSTYDGKAFRDMGVEVRCRCVDRCPSFPCGLGRTSR